MSISYTTNKVLEVPAIGTETNTWGTPLNNDWNYIDQSFGGTTTLNATGLNGTVSLTVTQYRPPNIVITGNPTGNLLYSIPSGVGGVWTIYNNTGNPYDVAFGSAGGGTYVVLQQGARTQVVSDGTNIQVADTYTIPIARGGTSATTATAAINNLLPSQTGSGGLFLTTDGSNVSWAAASGGGGGGSGTVTSIATAGSVNGLTLTGGPITTTGTITLGGTLTGVSLTSQVGGVLPTANGGTNLSSFTANGALYATSSSALTTGTLPTASGGTGLTSFTSGGALYANSSSSLTSGTLPISAGGTGLTATPSNGQIDIGNGSGFSRATLTAGSGITITNGSGTITISASGGGGTITSVTASSPLASSGGTTPNISLTGTVPVSNGGTGLTSFSTTGILYATGSSSLSTSLALTFNGSNLSTTNSASFSGITVGKGGTSDVYSTAVGSNALSLSANLGSDNTAVGYYALNYNGGAFNNAFGEGALYRNNSGSDNNAYGVNALTFNSSGYDNSAFGDSALRANTNGYYNCAFGSAALYTNTTGPGLVAVGASSLYYNSTGPFNTAIGYRAGFNHQTGGGCIMIGGTNSAGTYDPAYQAAFASNWISMGSTSVNAAYIQVGWTTVSDARDKTNFGTVPHGLDFVTKLNPISYQFKLSRNDDTPNGRVRYGFKAQEILALEGSDSIIIDATNPDKLYYNSESLVPVLVNAIKDLKSELDALKSEISAMKGV